jgi:urease accessory protein
MPISPFSHATSHSAGSGILELAVVNGLSVATKAKATNPLKLLIPRRPGPCIWVYTCTFGGGLVAGDHINLDVRLKRGSSCVLCTQSSTKVYRSATGQPCSQSLRADVEKDSLLIVAPDPISCFANANYEQKQYFKIRTGGALVLIDWMTSGRYACGERWEFSKFRSHCDVFMDDELVFRDALFLRPDDEPLDSPFRMGRFNCLASVVIIGGKVKGLSQRILEKDMMKTIQKDSTMIDAASPLKGGVIWRMMGESTEEVERNIRKELGSLEDIIGQVPWSRKW